MPVIINDVEDTEDTIEAPETPKQPQPPTRQMSNDEMIAMAIMSLATPLLGGMMGGKHGAQAGAVAGLKGAGMVAQNVVDENKQVEEEDRAFKRREAAEKDRFVNAVELEMVKDELRGDPEKKRQVTKNARGQPIDAVTGEIIDPSLPPPKPAPAVKGAKAPDVGKVEDKLRGDRDKHSITKRTNDLETSVRAMKSASPNAQGDLSLIFQYMKMLDPGSVVKEGEFYNAQNTTGIPGQVLNAYEKAKSGERLSDAQRKSFITEAEGLVKAQREAQKNYDKGITGIAERRGVNPQNVIINAFPEEQPAAPQLSPEDAAALKWANENPNDPRAAAIKQSLGAK